jgi:S-formylglutathione hydrolase
MSKSRIILIVVLGLLVVSAQAIAQNPADVNIPAYYIQDQITSLALEGNVLGDPATRPLLVYLPPSYDKEPERRYPTIYLLHGFQANETCFVSGGDFDLYFKSFGVDLGADVGNIVTELMAAGKMGEAIVVMPDASNSFGGSWYQKSDLIGDYRTYIAEELVTHIDTKYRTIADPNHRAIAGHSMGGYGALSLAIEYPDIFRAVAALSPVNDFQTEPNAIDLFVAQWPQEVGLLPSTDFITNIFYAWAAAFTPNLGNPPFFVDLPVKYPEKTAVPEIWQKWVDADLIHQIERGGVNLANTAILVVNGRGPTMLMEEVAADTLVAALYEKALSFTYVPTPGDHLSDLRMKLSVALEFLYPHIAAPVDAQ